jgi:hypothetical protein
VAQSLEVAKHDRHALRLRESIQLAAEALPGLVVILLVPACCRGHDRASPFPLDTPELRRACSRRDASGHAIKPARDRFLALDRTGLTRQDEEDRLRRVARVVRVPQHAATDALHHRPVARDDRLEGLLRDALMPFQKIRQERAVAEITVGARDK